MPGPELLPYIEDDLVEMIHYQPFFPYNYIFKKNNIYIYLQIIQLFQSKRQLWLGYCMLPKNVHLYQFQKKKLIHISLKSKESVGIGDSKALKNASENLSFSDSYLSVCWPFCLLLPGVKIERSVPADSSRFTKLSVCLFRRKRDRFSPDSI